MYTFIHIHIHIPLNLSIYLSIYLSKMPQWGMDRNALGGGYSNIMLCISIYLSFYLSTRVDSCQPCTLLWLWLHKGVWIASRF